MDTKSEIRALTGLRGIGAVWVFLFHLFMAGYKIPGIDQGDLAVPMFFVLSGFILFFVHEADFQTRPNARSLKDFFISRFARVYPLHLFVLLLLCVVVILIPGFAERYQSQRFSLANFFASLFLVQTWGLGHFSLFADASGAWNLPTWSLSAELVYYLLFPWVAYLFCRLGRRGYALPQAVICAVLALGFYSSLIDASGASYTRNLICGLFAFGLGMSICGLVMWKPVYPTLPFEVAGVALIVAKLVFPPLSPGLFVLGVAALIFSLVRSDSHLTRLLSSRVIYFLGKISFAVYIVHWPIIQLLNYAGPYIGLTDPLTKQIATMSLIPIICLTSYIVFLKVELPMRNMLRTVLKARS